MATRPLPPKTPIGSLVTKFQRLAKRNGFLYVGLPMMVSVVAGSLVLSSFQDVRMEIRDEKVKQYRNEEELGIKTKGKVAKKEEKKTMEDELKVGETGVDVFSSAKGVCCRPSSQRSAKQRTIGSSSGLRRGERRMRTSRGWNRRPFDLDSMRPRDYPGHSTLLGCFGNHYDAGSSIDLGTSEEVQLDAHRSASPLLLTTLLHTACHGLYLDQLFVNRYHQSKFIYPKYQLCLPLKVSPAP
jgi:hypothetical protein